eukprot:CAMPEP_0174825288 /NCGR_PEP_ID=MMETSP1107-20130205/42617_1 /TAXON_ID=36770 /ORGANISM="Paraphysomonas vestita, Strain GFlagA" /LENGTH=287 /DNA_ID=CAMNT_0016056765 /DNA_START=4202 /DNA_END=5065 /DNA_ORIENTATION=-
MERNSSLNNFHFYDPRSEDDLKAEKEIASKLKKAYKAAKAIVNKKKEKEREKAAASQPPNSTNLDLTVINEERHLEDIPEYSDYEEDDDEEETEFIEDPESIEIRDAFENFAVMYDDNVSRIPLDSLRSSLVQVFNRFISDEELKRALSEDIRIVSSPSKSIISKSLSIEEYRRLYFKLKEPDGYSYRSYDQDDEDLPKETPIQMKTTLRLNTSTRKDNNNNNKNQVPGKSTRKFWDSSLKEQSNIDEDLQEEEDSGVWSRVGGVEYSVDGGTPVGSAIHAARRSGR